MRLMNPLTQSIVQSRRAMTMDIFNEMEKLFTELGRSPSAPNNRTYFDAACDIAENEKNYNLAVDLPGFKKEDVHIDLKENTISIRGERRRESGDEKFVMHFDRIFTLPTNVDTERVEAQFEDGVLTLLLPKIAAAKARRIEIQTRTGGSLDKVTSSH